MTLPDWRTCVAALVPALAGVLVGHWQGAPWWAAIAQAVAALLAFWGVWWALQRVRIG